MQARTTTNDEGLTRPEAIAVTEGAVEVLARLLGPDRVVLRIITTPG